MKQSSRGGCGIIAGVTGGRRLMMVGLFVVLVVVVVVVGVVGRVG
jgi:hypothetical protein